MYGPEIAQVHHRRRPSGHLFGKWNIDQLGLSEKVTRGEHNQWRKITVSCRIHSLCQFALLSFSESPPTLNFQFASLPLRIKFNIIFCNRRFPQKASSTGFSRRRNPRKNLSPKYRI
ncbi:hypothetical protein QQ045_011890 [Rhodiola kirilowii]